MHPSAVWAAGAVAVSCVTSLGQVVRVEYWTDGQRSTFTQDFASGAPIVGLPALPVGLTRINVYSVGGNANIGTISFLDSPSQAGGSTTEFDLFLGQGEPPAGNLTPAGVNFGGINYSEAVSGRIRLIGAVSGDLTGRLVCARVTRLEVGGALGGEVVATAPDEAVGLIRADRIGRSASNQSGTQGGGATLGVIATRGRINALHAARTIDIPSPGSISASAGIADINARSVKARIIANAFGGNGNFGHLGCTAGDYEGVLSTNDLGSPAGDMVGSMIYLSGSLKGSVLVAGNLYGGVGVEGMDPVSGQSIGMVKVDGDFLGLIDGLGHIGRVEVRGDIRPDTTSFVLPAIRSRQGAINLVQVGGAIVGETDLLPTIQAAQINTLRIGGDARALIFGWPSGFVQIKHVDIGGSLLGSMMLSDFVTCHVRGDVGEGAQIWRRGELPPEDTITIGRALRGLILVDGPRGLNGGIVLNANLDPLGGWSPQGTVGIAPQSGSVRFMTRQEYTATGDEYGAGAVGVAPYEIRARDCLPNPHATAPRVAPATWPDGVQRETIKISLDGPVKCGVDSPLLIERAELAAPCRPGEDCSPQFKEVSQEYHVLVAPFAELRQIWISPRARDDGGSGTFSGGWLYRISPRLEDGRAVIMARGTNLSFSPGVGSFEYQVAVDSFDLNQDAATDELDLADWVRNPVDFNADGQATQADFEIITEAVSLHR